MAFAWKTRDFESVSLASLTTSSKIFARSVRELCCSVWYALLRISIAAGRRQQLLQAVGLCSCPGVAHSLLHTNCVLLLHSCAFGCLLPARHKAWLCARGVAARCTEHCVASLRGVARTSLGGCGSRETSATLLSVTRMKASRSRKRCSMRSHARHRDAPTRCGCGRYLRATRTESCRRV